MFNTQSPVFAAFSKAASRLQEETLSPASKLRGCVRAKALEKATAKIKASMLPSVARAMALEEAYDKYLATMKEDSESFWHEVELRQHFDSTHAKIDLLRDELSLRLSRYTRLVTSLENEYLSSLASVGQAVRLSGENATAAIKRLVKGAYQQDALKGLAFILSTKAGSQVPPIKRLYSKIEVEEKFVAELLSFINS